MFFFWQQTKRIRESSARLERRGLVGFIKARNGARRCETVRDEDYRVYRVDVVAVKAPVVRLRAVF